MSFLKKLFAHKHKFRRIDWDETLGSSMTDIQEYRFKTRDLYECKCGERHIHTYWAML